MRHNKIFPRLRPLFERLLAQPGEPSDSLFTRIDGTPLGDGAAAARYVRRRLKRCLLAAGIETEPKFTHKQCRTTMATWALSAVGGDLKTVAKIRRLEGDRDA